MAELKPMEVIMRIDFSANNGVEVVAHAEKVQELVRCKDCVHHKDAPQTTDVWCDRLDGLLPKDWFCADGERKTKGED